MDDKQDDSLDQLDCDELEKSGSSQVALWRGAAKNWRELDTKQEGRFRRIMQMWCEGHNLTGEMFNGNEGRSPGNIMLKAFKAFKIRLYGFERTVKKMRTFIVVDVDLAKKRDKADPNILKRAQKRVDGIGKEKK
jgi:hypothetical protein